MRAGAPPVRGDRAGGGVKDGMAMGFRRAQAPGSRARVQKATAADRRRVVLWGVCPHRGLTCIGHAAENHFMGGSLYAIVFQIIHKFHHKFMWEFLLRFHWTRPDAPCEKLTRRWKQKGKLSRPDGTEYEFGPIQMEAVYVSESNWVLVGLG